MAQTETKVAQVTLKDQDDRNRTINIDNPKDDLSLNQIKAAFAPAINGGWLLASNGSPITEVVEAKYNQVIKTQINGLPVTVFPSSLSLTIGANIKSTSGSVTISNGIAVSAMCDVSDNNATNTVKISGNTVQLDMYRLTNNSDSKSGTLTIFFEGNGQVQVPVTFTQEAIS